ncbi:MAG: hypothetical protein U1F54_14505 [Burkholderiales bacterium]
MTLLADLAEVPERLPSASRFTIWCGVFYAANGLLLLAWPGAVQVLFGDPAFAGREEALVRLIGMLLAIVGWFYFFGGRTGGRQFVASTVLDRLVLVPLVLIPTALAGVFPNVMFTFAVVDPALALVSWRLLSRDS